MKILTQIFICLTILLQFGLTRIVAEDNRIYIGGNTAIQSEVLGEARRLLISLPEEYPNEQDRYPVLYLLDGMTHFVHTKGVVDFLGQLGKMPPTIIVGIANVDRNRDFVPVNIPQNPTTGHADKFLNFLESELIPYIDQTYRTHPYRIIMGHSYGGTFNLYTLMNRPEVFHAYLTISPAIDSHDVDIFPNLENDIELLADKDRFLYLTLGDEPNMKAEFVRLTTLLQEKNLPGLEWHERHFPDEDHGSVPHLSIYHGLRTLFADWQISGELITESLNKIKQHYRDLSAKFNFEVPIPENVLNARGYQLLQEYRYSDAIEVFALNVELYPNSANVYDSLGEAYEADGQLKMALDKYQLACEKGKPINDPNLPIFEQHLKNVQEKLRDMD